MVQACSWRFPLHATTCSGRRSALKPPGHERASERVSESPLSLHMWLSLTTRTPNVVGFPLACLANQLTKGVSQRRHQQFSGFHFETHHVSIATHCLVGLESAGPRAALVTGLGCMTTVDSSHWRLPRGLCYQIPLGRVWRRRPHGAPFVAMS